MLRSEVACCTAVHAAPQCCTAGAYRIDPMGWRSVATPRREACAACSAQCVRWAKREPPNGSPRTEGVTPEYTTVHGYADAQ